MNNNTFPCLRRLNPTSYNVGAAGIIVCFTAPKIGIVINNDNAVNKGSYLVGYRSYEWIRFDSEEDWEPVDCSATQVISSFDQSVFDS